MVQAFRALIVGIMLTGMLAACGGGTTDTGANASTAASAGASVAASAAPSMAAASASAEPSMAAASTSAAPSMAATASAEPSMAATSAAMEATTEATGTAAAVTLPEVDPGEVTGDIITAGSSTVFPLSQRMAEVFKDEGYTGNITIDSVGSGAGIERFCVAAETDIANSSRAMKDEERTQCQEKGREVVEFRVGTDALTVVVSNQNDFLTELSLAQLADIYSGKTKNWSDVDASYPNEPIQLFSPGTDSGTFDYFVETVFEDLEEEQRTAAILGANPQLSEDDNVLVQGVEGSPYAIGYFGYAYFQENESRLKAVAIDGVEPTEESAESGDYPISRPLFIYSAESILQEKPQVAAFINFYLSRVNDEIVDVGYFPASEESLNEARQSWLDAANQ